MNYAEYISLVKDIKVPSTYEVEATTRYNHPETRVFNIISLGNTKESIIKIPNYYQTENSPVTLVNNIGGHTFKNRNHITDIILFIPLYNLPNGGFAGCTNLRNIVLPKGVVVISEGAFSGCDKLDNIYFEGTEEEWKAIKIKKEENTIQFGGKVKGKPVVIFSSENSPLYKAHVYFNCDLSLINQNQ